MPHSVLSDLYVPPIRFDEEPTEEGQRWGALTKEINGLPEAARYPKALQALLSLDPARRLFLCFNDSLARAVIEAVAREATRGLILACVGDESESSEAYTCAVAWLRNLKLDERMLRNIAQECVVYGEAVVWVDAKRPSMGIASRQGWVEVGTQGTPRLVAPNREPFGEDEDERVYIVPLKEDVASLQTSLVSLLDSMLKDTLATLGLDRVRPRVGIEHPVEDVALPSSWAQRLRFNYYFPAVNGLDEDRGEPRQRYRITPRDV